MDFYMPVQDTSLSPRPDVDSSAAFPPAIENVFARILGALHRAPAN
jgi:hypothetical protein